MHVEEESFSYQFANVYAERKIRFTHRPNQSYLIFSFRDVLDTHGLLALIIQ